MFDKFGSRGFAVLAINIEPLENADVVPMFSRMGLALTPLEPPNAGWADTAFHVNAVPVDDLVDPQGRLVLERIDLSGTAARTVLQNAIEQLLPRSAGRKAMPDSVRGTARSVR